jgi:hypothetical protein
MKTSATTLEAQPTSKKDVHRFRTMVAHNKQDLLEPIMGVQLNQSGLGHKRQLCRDMFGRACSLASRDRRAKDGTRLEACDDGEIYTQLRAMVYPDEAKQTGPERKEEKVYNVGVMDNEKLITRANKVTYLA